MRTILIRLGSIGDLFSAYSFCLSRGYDLFVSESILTFLRIQKDSGRLDPLCKILQEKNDLRVYRGQIHEFLKLLDKEQYSKILIYAQSESGMSFFLLKNILIFLSFFRIINKQIEIKVYYNGGQYIHQVNSSSKIRQKLRKLPSNPVISIFYDGKEKSKNLNAQSLKHICDFIFQKFTNPVVSIYGSTHLPLDVNIENIINLTGKTKLSDIESVVESTDLAITVDSGPMHIFSLHETPCIVFMSGRHPILNWTPLIPTNYYIYDDALNCIGCQSNLCPLGVNVCVNSKKNLLHFESLFKIDLGVAHLD